MFRGSRQDFSIPTVSFYGSAAWISPFPGVRPSPGNRLLTTKLLTQRQKFYTINELLGEIILIQNNQGFIRGNGTELLVLKKRTGWDGKSRSLRGRDGTGLLCRKSNVTRRGKFPSFRFILNLTGNPTGNGIFSAGFPGYLNGKRAGRGVLRHPSASL